MQVFDASSIIYAWDNYPLGQFPALWEWMSDEIDEGEFVMCRVAYDEVKRRSPDCWQWLKNNRVELLELTNDIVQHALRIKQALGIVGDKYHPKGVGENDLFIIATALVHGVELVSDEGRQAKPPDVLRKAKIPLVCARPDVGVRCINFVEYMKRSRRVFG